MGSNFSNHSIVDDSDGSSHGKKSRIMSFHSKDQWKTHFTASKQTNKLIVIDFTATWCGPCRSMEPALKEYADKYTDVEFVKLDVDELPDVAMEFGVQAMPSFLFIKKGEVIDRVVGARKEELQRKIEKHRN
ncbi:putative monodehydroascorbate reductase (NADH) [Rosa chinensis]|uniref:Putative monodehydroascorbate reductase (NADH) n=1 Tax=Rosa chinensis TaxID=74649 RepID=A0A2P6R4C1_ROSCH|nr:thioredoxin H2 [Rosa chinensis]PRQ41286.1 putative monodehydroascorbate reductase (NADH) [Rosa chinensis]